jgi:hypothetical protein
MSNPQPISETGPQVPAGPVAPALPSEQEMIGEIDNDRRHERYLLRAALVATLVIGLALAVRVVWG